MLNFLPRKNKKQIIIEYLLRIVIVFLLFVFVSSIVLITLFSPTFFFAKYNNDTIKNQLESINSQAFSSSDDPIAIIKNTNELSKSLSSNEVKNMTYNDIVNKIVSLKNKDIKIFSIDITEGDAITDKEITIKGIANTRDSLTLFEKDIKTDGFFSNVLFPVSNFIKNSDSEFSATLIL